MTTTRGTTEWWTFPLVMLVDGGVHALDPDGD